MSKLIQNAAKIPEDDLYLVSTDQHDYVTHVFRDGLELSLDGGLAYPRRVGDLYKLHETKPARYEEYCLVEGEPFEGWIAERLLWGTRGKDGQQPLRYRPIKELAYAPDGIEHLRNILLNCPNVGPVHTQVISYWLEKRLAETAAAPSTPPTS